MTLPNDRGHLSTERRHGDSLQLDTFSTRQCVDVLARDHARVVEAVAGAADTLTAFIDAIVPRMRRGGRLVYLGAGTSGRLGVLDAAECPPTFQSCPDQVVGLIAGGDASLRRSSEGKEDDPDGAVNVLHDLGLSEMDTVLGIAAGGTTPYVLGGIAHSHRSGALTGLLCCAGASAPEGCDHVIVLETGPEVLTGSTRLKAGSATKLALNIISTTVFVQLGKVYENLMVDLRATNDKLADRAIRILIELCPDLTRASAANLLAQAEHDLKAAIVMARLHIDSSTARSLLREHNGVLRSILEHGMPEDSIPV